MCGRLPHRPHLVEIHLRTEPRGLPRGLNPRQSTTNNIDLILLHPRKSASRFWGIDFVILHVAREMFIVTPLDRLVVIATSEQQHLNRKIDVREARQPNTLLHPRLLDHQRRTRLQRHEQAAGHLESFREARFQTYHLFINRIDPNDADQLRNQTLFTRLRLESGARTKIENDRLATRQHLTARRHKLACLQERRYLGAFRLFLLTLGAPLGHLLLVFLFLAFGFFKLFLHAPVFFGRAFRRKRHAVLTDQLLDRLAIGKWINFIDLHGLFFQCALAVDLAIRFCLFERVFRNAIFQFILIPLDFTHQRDDVESILRARWIEQLVVDAGVESDFFEEQRQLARALDIHAKAMRFLDAVDRAILIEDHPRLVYIARHLRDETCLHAEVILKMRAAATGKVDDVCRFGSEIAERHDACEYVEFFE